MEIRARYTLIGMFTLAVIGVGFGFVYWLNTSVSFRQRAVYQVRYDSPVSGLLVGSAVLFNGIRVGEVTRLRLEPQAPRDVLVEISIERLAPVRADTRIGLEFQGLTGAPVVSLSGGTPSLPLLYADKGGTPMLVAEKNAGLGMAQAAREVLKHVDSIVIDNAEPLRSLVANLDRFSGALARNADRVDGIVAGLERLTGGGAKAATRVFDLAPAKSFPATLKVSDRQIQVLEPTALSLLDNEKIVARQADGTEAAALANSKWPDLLPKVIQTRVAQSFENAGFGGVLARVPDGTRSDVQLVIDVRNFQISGSAPAVAEVELAAKIIGAEGRVIDARTFRATQALTVLESEVAASELSRLFGSVTGDLVAWTASKL